MEPADSRQILFLSHGGGPLPLLGDPGHRQMVDCLSTIAGKLRPPAAIVVISAHWEEPVATLTAGAHPALIYDYVGFPPESYAISYPCAGHPPLAQRIQALLSQAQIPARLDGQRGFDHGLFVPLKLLFPEATIPCVQLSLLSSLDPAEHWALGRALQPLTRENVLVIGSGFSFHNLQQFFGSRTPESVAANTAFEAWLVETVSSPAISQQDRERRLIHWEQAPGARQCHPREEHLLPLHVCCGLAQSACSEVFELEILHRKTCMVLWQSA